MAEKHLFALGATLSSSIEEYKTIVDSIENPDSSVLGEDGLPKLGSIILGGITGNTEDVENNINVAAEIQEKMIKDILLKSGEETAKKLSLIGEESDGTKVNKAIFIKNLLEYNYSGKLTAYFMLYLLSVGAETLLSNSVNQVK